MKYTALILSTALVTVGFAPFAFAQNAAAPTASPAASQETPPTATVPASSAQLKREHDRAVKAGDAANDPFDPSSSDALNQQQLQSAQAALAAMPTPAPGNTAVLPPEQTVPGNADVTPDATTPDTSQPGQPGTPDTVPPVPSPDTPDSVPPAPDSSPPTTDDSPKSTNPIEPHSN